MKTLRCARLALPPNVARAVRVPVKALTYAILTDCMAEAWSRHDPQLLADVYRATSSATDLLTGRA